jgi:hypothetical protein
LTHQGAGSQFQEWSHLRAQEPIRQGDILRAIASDGDPWRRWLIVITADCDLAHAKHDGALSCVSVLHHLDYISRFRTEKVSSAIEDRIIREILKIVSAAPFDSPDMQSRPKVSPPRMSAWIMEADPAEILSTLGISNSPGTKMHLYMQCYRDLVKGRESGEISLLLDAFASAKFAMGEGKSKNSTRAGVAKELAASLKTLPGDAIFISSLADDARDGYVAYLRRIHEVQDHHVTRSTVSVPKDAQFYRMGRLTAPYIYALTQQVGTVFGAIGLPTEYEIKRSETVELFSLLQSEEE